MKNKRTGKQVLISVLIVVAWAALASMTGTRRVLSAATFTVTNTGDNGGVNPASGAGTGTLRQAIVDANAAAGADTINFAAGVTGTVTLLSALPQITESVTISGPGADVLTVSGNSLFQVFNIAGGGVVSISGLTISNANSRSGIGIYNAGMLMVTNSTLSGNAGAGSFGGGIYNVGTLTLTNSTLSGNPVFQGGAISNNQGATLTSGKSEDEAPLPVQAALCAGGIVINGSITTQDPTELNRILGADPPSTCTNVKTCPGSDSGGPFHYDAYTLVNNSGTDACVTVTLDPVTCTASPNLLSATAYLGSFDPNNVCTNYLADIGASPSGPKNFSFIVPNAATYVIVVNEVTPNAGCAAYALTVCQEPCTIICPDNITVPNDPGQCGAVVNPSVTTPCGGTITCSPAAGSFFPLGTTTVTCTAEGAQCSFTVTVNDTQPPMITCPANITQSTDPNQCSAVVTYATPTANDNCPGVGAAVCSPLSGSTFSKGITTVTCAVSDASGNIASCTFTVTVSDTQPPTITCPANITKNTDPGLCTAVATYTTPMATDNCSQTTVACSPASGSAFPKGTTTVTCTATDTSGNTSSCSFTVTVNDTQAPTINCPASVTAAAAQTCPISSNATVNFTVTASDNCPGVVVLCNPPSGSIFPVGTTSVTCTATDTSGNTASCSFTVTVFSGCLQDDSNPANVVLFNAATGEYRFCCGGTVFSGVGTLLVKGCVVTIQHYPADRRVLIKFDGGTSTGTASLQSPPGSIKCTITDRNTRNNTCACQVTAGLDM
jgi:hypothetical protein